jgi:hypothetical protein
MGMAEHICIPIQEAKTEGSWVQDQHDLHRKTLLFLKKKKTGKKKSKIKPDIIITSEKIWKWAEY